MKLFSYIVARDFGFAPNPFHGFCTLATCKPQIRRSASVGDWVVGTGAQTKYSYAGRLIFAMQVTEVVDYDSYWNEQRFACKRPVLNGSLKLVYGDNIYHRKDGVWAQADSHHSLEGGRANRRNVLRDTSADRVLIGSRFVYYGEQAPAIPARVRGFGDAGKDLCCRSQGHTVHADRCAASFEAWLEKRGIWGLVGMPLEFRNHSRSRGTAVLSHSLRG